MQAGPERGGKIPLLTRLPAACPGVPIGVILTNPSTRVLVTLALRCLRGVAMKFCAGEHLIYKQPAHALVRVLLFSTVGWDPMGLLLHVCSTVSFEKERRCCCCCCCCESTVVLSPIYKMLGPRRGGDFIATVRRSRPLKAQRRGWACSHIFEHAAQT